ncbi:MAG: SulP family inorganic anion transporter [Gemmataceae bacterium]|nr:SulP family inorganic anion transporter [Gemmataceae bacterium]MCI0739511.1 SulP family inorganic anion transporter [Gemmataceae bacterium]
MQSAFDWRSLLPPVQWLPHYQVQWLKSDVIAGITLAAYAVPVSMAYAALAGLPPHHGIYCYLLGGLCYAVFGTSRQLAVGPTSAIALLVGATVAGMADGDPARWTGIASLTALVVAFLSALAWLLRLSGLVSFISETILLGFKAGAALTIAMTQLPKLFGVSGGGDHFIERIWILAGQLGETNVAVFGMGLVALALLLLGEKFLPGRPIALLVVAVAIVVVSLTSLKEAGVATVGALPAGLPEFSPPAIRLRDVDGILPLSLACLLLAYIEGISAARTLAAKNNYEIDPRQELLALGAANLAVAFGQGFPVAGGLSQSVVNDKAGARSPLALLFASATLAICLLFLTDLLANLPSVVLAAIVLVAVRGLIDLRALRHLWQVSRLEFKISMVALVGVLLLGILKGVLVAAIASLLMLLAGAARPHVAFLGRIPGTRRYSDLERHPDNEELPGIVVFRAESSVLYFNADHIRRVVAERLQAIPQVRLVVCDLSDAPLVDVAGARMIYGLHVDLAKRGIQMRVVEAHAKVRDLLRAEGLEERLGYLGRHLSVDQAIAEFQAFSRTS